MANFESFEDIVSWQKAIDVAQEIYSFTNKEVFSKDFALKDQIRKSAISIPSNIAEGFGRGGNKEFIQFLYIAKGSLFELKTQILLACKLKYIEQNEYKSIDGELDEISKLISGLLNYLNSSELKGTKFKK